MRDVVVACEHLRVQRSHASARITLDRPAKYNALTRAMVWDMTALLDAWKRDDAVQVVLIDGAGERGLCAGGDLTILLDSVREQDERAFEYWAEEYRLNATIAAYPKPIVAFMSGTVMGAGVGLSAHARHRVVTTTTRLAMPEGRIGLIPDVGATWLLPRAPGETGTYLALTGARVGAADAILLGLADYFVPAEKIEPLTAALLDLEGPDDDAVGTILARFAEPPGEAPLARLRPSIDRAFARDTVDAILGELDDDDSEFARSAAREIRANSPTSVALTLRTMRLGRELDNLEACLQLEYRVMRQLLFNHDFSEGARAAIIDKDRAPKWNPASLAELSGQRIEAYFTVRSENELQL